MAMRFCIVGAGAVGGYFGAKLAQSGHQVTFIARGAHLAVMRERGLTVKSPALGDFTVTARAEERPEAVGAVDAVIFAVKFYSNAEALPAVRRILDGSGPAAAALTLQNGIDSTDQVSAAVGRERVLGGTTYVATALTGPGVIEQVGTHRRVVFGEAVGGPRPSERVDRIAEAMRSADIEAEGVADPRVAIWEKFCYLAPFSAFTSASRLPIGPLWSDPAIREVMIGAYQEMEAIARAEPVAVDPGITARIIGYLDALPGTTRSSMLIDLLNGKPTELEALAGAAVRRARASRVPAPILSALYAVLKPHASVTR
jgi:2-dehydropantoate 2-reductase